MTTITPQEFNQRKQAGEKLMLVDVRTELEYAQVHADGAVNHPLQTLNPQALIKTCTDSNQTLVFLCKGGKRGSEACQKVVEAGYNNVINIAGGTEAWVAAGLPNVSDRKVMSLERQVRIAAGALVLLGVVLGFSIHPGFFGISGFVGCGLIFAGVTDWCGMGMLIAQMPWNKGFKQTCGGSSCAS